MIFRHSIRLGSLLAWVGLLVGAASAQSNLLMDAPVTARSVSGEFVVHGRGPGLPAPQSEVRQVGTNPVVRLRPDLLVVTAERVKRGIERLLDVRDSCRGTVHLQLRDPVRVTGPLAIQAKAFRDGWQYYAVIPDEVGWERLIRGLTEMVLLERANRANSGEECALVPLWLTSGLYQLMIAAEGRDLVTESGTLINRSQRRPDPLRDVRAMLDGREPMSFSEISLMTVEQLEDPAQFAFFQASAALLTHQLLREDLGSPLMVEFIRRLPESLNWQTVFLRVYGDHFPRLLDVEKWWAVAAAEVLASDSRQQWSRERVLARLAELLVETAETRPDTNSPAVRQDIPLRELLVTWDFDSQKDVIRRKASQMRALGLRAPSGVAPLVGESARVLEDYMAVRGRPASLNTGKTLIEVRGQLVAEAAARKLAALEVQIEYERQHAPPAPPAPADPARMVAPPGRSPIRAVPSSGG